MLYGVSYYPEHKTREELEWDLKLIKESGINTVRMGEFAWCRMEPEPGKYEFSWLDEVVEELGKAGIRSILCTPTACPPAWMVELWPDMLYQDNRRIRRPFGGRRHGCYNHGKFREASAGIAKAIGKHYGSHPYVAGFQIDNELAQEGTGRCTCDICQKKFQSWMEHKYGNIETFNKRSGAIFWSQECTHFGQILPPVNAIEPGAQEQIQDFYENPGIRLDFERFSSECQIEFQNIQADILKSHTAYPVTTNGTGLATNSIDYYESFQSLDCYAFDYYPNLRDSWVSSFPYAFGCGVKPGVPFWVLEFMSGGGHRFGGTGRLQPGPGALKQAVVQSFAYGAELMLHFQFRSFPVGAEQLNYAIVDLDGIPRRRYREMQETAAVLKRLEPLAEAAFPSEVGMLLNYDSHWALAIKPVNKTQFSYMGFAEKIYNNLERIGIHADIISSDRDFSGYRALILPASFVLDRMTAERLKCYVEAGGLLISTFLTGVKNKDNLGYTVPLPAYLTDMFGVSVQEVEPVFDSNQTDLILNLTPPGGDEKSASQVRDKDGAWSELLAGDARAIGTYAGSYKKDSMVISEHIYGAGKACYIGTDLSDDAWRKILDCLLSPVCRFKDEIQGPERVQVMTRIWKDKRIYYLFNFSGSAVTVTIPRGKTDVLTGKRLSGEINLEANGFQVVM